MLVMLSSGITNVALPVLSRDFAVDRSEIVWITTAFQTAAVALTIPLASLSEIIGIRRVYVGGMTVFMIGAAFCGLADGYAELVAARVLQGLGAAGISAVNAALLRLIIPERMLARGIALIAIVVGAAQGLAPLAGSAILEYASWQWLFLYNIPLCAVGIALALWSMPRDTPASHRFDWGSAILCAATLGLLVVGIDRIAKSSPGDWTAALLLLVSIAAGTVLLRGQRRRHAPLFPIDLFATYRFALPISTSTSMYTVQGLSFAAFPFLFINTLDMSLLEAGVLLSIWPLASFVASPIAGFLADRFPALPITSIGCVLAGLGVGVAHLTASHEANTFLSAWIALAGIGFAGFQSANAKDIILGAPVSRMGAASGVQSTARVFGQMFGTALLGISFHLFGDFGTGTSLWLAVALCAAAAVNSYIHNRLKRRASRAGEFQITR